MRNDQVSDQASVIERQMVPGWYPIAASAGVVKRKPIGVKRFGESLVLWRSDDGAWYACPIDALIARLL